MTETVYCFDRDRTVDTSNGPVPVAHISELAEEHPVWAIGNQRLKEEADIPGLREARARQAKSEGETADHAGHHDRKDRLLLIESMFPDAGRYIHVDDTDVGIDERERWTYYTPGGYIVEL